MREERIIEQLDRMVAAGRIARDEAAGLRTTEATPDFDAASGAIRARHAGGHMETAVGAGEMTAGEAESYLGRLCRGEHPDGLRARLQTHRRN